MSETATRPALPLALALAAAIGAGIVAVAFAAIVLLVVQAGFSFADRVDLLGPAVLARWEGRIIWLLAFTVVAIAIRAGVVLANPQAPPGRAVGAMIAGIGVGLVLVASPLWPAAAVGAGWGFGIGRNPAEIGIAAGVGVVLALIGLAFEPTSLLDASIQGIVGAAFVATIIAIADIARNLVPGPSRGA